MENKKIIFKNKRGFTLIEMLIVIVIIGILAAAIIPRLNSARGRANDVARKADLNQVATALITYQLDTSGFPITGGHIGEEHIKKALLDGGMTSIPKDPANNLTFSGIEGISEGQTSSYYLYTPIKKNGIPNGGFVLMAQMESHGQANYIVCNNGDFIKNSDDYTDINLCSTISEAKESEECNLSNCKYKKMSELRYIYKY